MRYSGMIGFAPTKNKGDDDIWSEKIEEHPYKGDIVRHSYNAQNVEKLTDDVQVNMQISIVANEFAYNFMHLIRYATWRGVKWRVTSVEPQYPRLLLSLGGVYNG